MDEVCEWLVERESSRAWLYPSCKVGQDSEQPSVVNNWRFCPYCGKRIEANSGTQR